MAPTTLTIILTGLIFIAIECFFPGRKWKSTQNWWPRAIALNICQVLVVYIAAATWNAWLQNAPLLQIEDKIGTVPAALSGYFLITFVFYWWHRARHEVPMLWVWLHQIHHSPERLETMTAFYKHPLEMGINSIAMSAILYFLLGLGPQAAALATLMTGLAELFYHWNVKTPRWIGYFIQRPESHCIHHQRGWHTQNYSDLPLWDILFGTFHNPQSFEKTCGFKNDRELQLGTMLIGKDVNPPKKKEA